MNIALILASAAPQAVSDSSFGKNDFLYNLLPILAAIVHGLLVLAIMVFITLRKNLPR